MKWRPVEVKASSTGGRQCLNYCNEEGNEQRVTHILSTLWEVFNGKFRAREPFHSTLRSSFPGTAYQSTKTIIIRTVKFAKDGEMQTHCSFTHSEDLEVHLPTLTSIHACTLLLMTCPHIIERPLILSTLTADSLSS